MLQTEVTLRHSDHRYFDNEGNEYASVSKMLGTLKEPFDADMMSKRCAGKGKYAGMTAKEVRTAWTANAKESTDHGSSIHDAIDNYTKTGKIKDADTVLDSMLKSIVSDYIPYKKTYDECVMYLKFDEPCGQYHGIAGMSDRILVVTKSIADVEDYKTNIKKGIEFNSKYNQYMKYPVEHLQDCNFNQYSLQLSVYGLLYENLTQSKIRSLWIRFIPQDDPLNHRRIPIPYLRTDAINAIRNFQELQNKTEFAPIKTMDTDIPSFG